MRELSVKSLCVTYEAIWEYDSEGRIIGPLPPSKRKVLTGAKLEAYLAKLKESQS
jgi:hypothetical protein